MTEKNPGQAVYSHSGNGTLTRNYQTLPTTHPYRHLATKKAMLSLLSLAFALAVLLHGWDGLILFSFGSTIHLRATHLVFVASGVVVLGLILIRRDRLQISLSRELRYPLLLTGVITVCWGIETAVTGQFSAEIARYWLWLMVLFTAAGLAQLSGYETMVRAIRTACLAVICIVVLKDYVDQGDILSVLFSSNSNVRPNIPTIFLGGINIEASWLVIFSALFVSRKYFLPLYLVTLAVAIAYASRTAITASALLWAFYIVISLKRVSRKTLIIQSLLVIAVFIMALGPQTPLAVAHRVHTIGAAGDKGSQGRMMLWRASLEAIRQNPLGYGAGHEMQTIEAASGDSFRVGNVHNVPLQFMLNSGIFGLIAFLLLAGILMRRSYDRPDGLAIAVLLYLACCLTEFRFVEVQGALLIGAHLALRSKRDNSKDF